MKRIATAIGVLAMVLVPATAQAQDTFDWSGHNGTSVWHASGNWFGTVGEYPDSDSDGIDTVNIKDGSPLPDHSTGTSVVSTITIDADPNSATVSLTVSGGSLTTGSLVMVKGDQSGTATATLEVQSGGTLDPNSLCFWGRDHLTDGHAYGDFDASVTVQGSAGGVVETYMEGRVDITFTNSVTVDSKDLQVGDYGSSGNSGAVTLSGAGTLSACSVVIKGDSASGNSTVTASNGAMLQTY